MVVAEDAKFYTHNGFDYESLQNALKKDIKARKFKIGASTITQQLAKNLYLSPSKNPVRKIKEAILTWRLERTLSKRRMLELYLNVVEWGDGIFGVETAAEHYFNKPASALTAGEAARLAAVLPNPIRFNAASQSRYVIRRSNLILAHMNRAGAIPERDTDENDATQTASSLQDILTNDNDTADSLDSAR